MIGRPLPRMRTSTSLGRCDKVVVAALSMGGTLAVWLASRHPEIAGLALVNPVVQPLDASITDFARDLADKGEAMMPGVGSDIADPDQRELAYEQTPVVSLLSLASAIEALTISLPDITMPLLLMNAPQDHVVPPTNSEMLAAAGARSRRTGIARPQLPRRDARLRPRADRAAGRRVRHAADRRLTQPVRPRLEIPHVLAAWSGADA